MLYKIIQYIVILYCIIYISGLLMFLFSTMLTNLDHDFHTCVGTNTEAMDQNGTVGGVGMQKLKHLVSCNLEGHSLLGTWVVVIIIINTPFFLSLKG